MKPNITKNKNRTTLKEIKTKKQGARLHKISQASETSTYNIIHDKVLPVLYMWHETKIIKLFSLI